MWKINKGPSARRQRTEQAQFTMEDYGCVRTCVRFWLKNDKLLTCLRTLTIFPCSLQLSTWHESTFTGKTQQTFYQIPRNFTVVTTTLPHCFSPASSSYNRFIVFSLFLSLCIHGHIHSQAHRRLRHSFSTLSLNWNRYENSPKLPPIS